MYILIIFIGVLLPFFSFGQENPTKTYQIEYAWQKDIVDKQQKTVEDYFLLLPSSIIDCENTNKGYPTIRERLILIEKKDLKNGYIQFHKTGQFVLFKDRVNNKDILAVQYGKCGAGNTCGALNTLLEIIENKWIYRIDLLPNKERMEDVYNRLSEEDICPYFDLPQTGTTIIVRDENNEDSMLFRYIWNGQRFEIDNN